MRAVFTIVLLLVAGSSFAQVQPSGAPSTTAVAVAPAPKTFFVRLIPPRPTFGTDMTEDEGKLMGKHFVYWSGLFKQGVCLFGGPVLDPKGMYGVLVIRAGNQDEAKTIAAADPSVKAGLNRIEIAEMQVAFLPGAH